ncbi:MAG: acyl-CoA dehydrogenase family protein [Hyphomicrobiaceae bacterium]
MVRSVAPLRGQLERKAFFALEYPSSTAVWVRTSFHAAMAKMLSAELMCDILHDCLQLFGGNGCMWEYPIARAWADARMSRIAGGTCEIMREIIGRSMFGDRQQVKH